MNLSDTIVWSNMPHRVTETVKVCHTNHDLFKTTLQPEKSLRVTV